MKSEKRAIRLATEKPKKREIDNKALVPRSRGLLKTIKRFTQTRNMIGKIRIDVSRRLTHVDSFSKVIM